MPVSSIRTRIALVTIQTLRRHKLHLAPAAAGRRTVADEVCSMEEAGLLYPRLGLLANLGLAGSGGFIAAVHRAVGPGGMGAVLQVLTSRGGLGPC